MSGNGNIGHNSENGELTADQWRALGYYHKGKWEAALAVKKKGDADLKNTAKRSIADGISVDDIKRLIELDTPEGEAKVRAELQRTIQVAGWANSEIGKQFAFDDIPDRSPLEERAYEEGKTAGMKAATASSPYEGEAGERWMTGWHEGQAALFSIKELSEARAVAEANSGDDGEEQEPEPKRARGRPKLTDEEKAARKAAKASSQVDTKADPVADDGAGATSH